METPKPIMDRRPWSNAFPLSRYRRFRLWLLRQRHAAWGCRLGRHTWHPVEDENTDGELVQIGTRCIDCGRWRR